MDPTPDVFRERPHILVYIVNHFYKKRREIMKQIQEESAKLAQVHGQDSSAAYPKDGMYATAFIQLCTRNRIVYMSIYCLGHM